jgi:hypothetical protein
MCQLAVLCNTGDVGGLQGTLFYLIHSKFCRGTITISDSMLQIYLKET